jgi:hypothetical protein
MLVVLTVACCGACAADGQSLSSPDGDEVANDSQVRLDDDGDIRNDAENEGVAPDAVSIGGFPSSLFKFVTIVHDPGTGPAGGWQEARTRLNFVDTRPRISQRWSCPLVVGMPIRSSVFGQMSKAHAADISAAVADAASARVMHSRPEWLPALFCIKFAEEMNRLFRKEYDGLGASARSR